MIWTKLFAIAFMIGIDVLGWVILRHYSRRGIILAFPWSIQQDRTPRWFHFNMLVGWFFLALGVVFTFVVSLLLLLDQ